MSAAETPTPEFLVWALARPCELRQIDRWEEPERTERHLRAGRELGIDRAKGRCQGEWSYDDRRSPRLSFNIAEALSIYGGPEAAEAACGGCPVNVLAQLQPNSLAGCYGEFPVPQPASTFYERIDACIEQLHLAEAV